MVPDHGESRTHGLLRVVALHEDDHHVDDVDRCGVRRSGNADRLRPFGRVDAHSLAVHTVYGVGVHVYEGDVVFGLRQAGAIQASHRPRAA